MCLISLLNSVDRYPSDENTTGEKYPHYRLLNKSGVHFYNE